MNVPQAHKYEWRPRAAHTVHAMHEKAHVAMYAHHGLYYAYGARPAHHAAGYANHTFLTASTSAGRRPDRDLEMRRTQIEHAGHPPQRHVVTAAPHSHLASAPDMHATGPVASHTNPSEHHRLAAAKPAWSRRQTIARPHALPPILS